MKRLASILLFVGVAFAGQQTTSIMANGTWTAPSNSYGTAYVEIWGAGGNGGDADSFTNPNGAGGGGSGGYAKCSFTITPNTVYHLNAGGPGVTSTVTEISSCNAVGGSNGLDPNSGGNGGSGGGASGNVTTINGSNGQDGQSGSGGTGGGAPNGGGGGGSADSGGCDAGGGGFPGGGGGGGYFGGCSGGGGGNTGYRFTYNYDDPPTTVSLSGIPTNINYGTAMTLIAVCRDIDGYTDINQCLVLVGYGVDGGNSCYIQYIRSSNAFNNVGSTSMCRLNSGSSSVTSSTDITLTISVTPLPAQFAHGQTQNGYMYISDNESETAGWNYMNVTGTLRGGPSLTVSNHGH